MALSVEASTVAAAQLFSTSRFVIPDFQRRYSWDVGEQVAEFWDDLCGALGGDSYFLGLLIVTNEQGAKVVVDGQQRLITVSLLADAIRRAAEERGKNLLASNIRDTFLFGLDYATEERFPRVQLQQPEDHEALSHLTTSSGLDTPQHGASKIWDAALFLRRKLEADLNSTDSNTRLADWATFLSSGLQFALFEHPNRNAAFKVYEVVNTRGKDLTPADLIKSHFIGSMHETKQREIHERWMALEQHFDALGASGQFTQFVRHVVALTQGYVLPRDLYQTIAARYPGEQEVEALLAELEDWLETYLLMVDPSVEDSGQDVISDEASRAFAVLDSIGIRTVRPDFARSLRSSPDDTGLVDDLLQELRPSRRTLVEAVTLGRINRNLGAVLRSSVAQQTALPELSGWAHQVRPGNADGWNGFSQSDYKELGLTIGNLMVIQQERRPRNTNSPEGAALRLFTLRTKDEEMLLPHATALSHTATFVREQNRLLGLLVGDIWHDGDI
jgi:hypothetical protein